MVFSGSVSRVSLRSGLRARAARPVTANALASGDQVQFKDKLVVYHIPGKKEGLDVAGMTGTVVQDVTMYKGVELSPNFPFKIQLETEVKGKAKKFFVHVVEGEVNKC